MRGINVNPRRSRAMLVPAGAVVLVAVALLVFLLFPDPSGDVPSPSGDRFAQIDAYVEAQLDGSSIPGAAIAIVGPGGIQHARGFGEDGRGSAITPETPFWIGSNTKSFTALAVMQLVEAGKVELDAPAQRYVPEFRVADEQASQQITVRQLLNQTSGLSRASGVKPVLEGEVKSLEQTIRDMRDVELNRPVGESYEYSNYNFVVLGAVVERVSGESWTQYIERHVFSPLGMAKSFTSLEQAEAQGLTATHRFAFGVPLQSDVKYQPGIAPTGWLYSTAEDMARYLAMYLRGGAADGARLLSQQGIDTMLTGNTNDRTQPLQSQQFTFQYGEGWFVGEFGAAQDARWHLGNLPQFTAWMVLLPETDQGVIVLINAGSQFELLGVNAAFSRIPIGIVNLLREEAPPVGMGMTRFYVLYDALVVAVLTVQTWSLIRVAARSREGAGFGWRSVVPLSWELALSLLLLVMYPATLGAGWQAAIAFMPDLSLTLLIVSLLWLLTGVARVGRFVVPLISTRSRVSTLARGTE
jgi:CubicO group peptidase (beta-lactamase class C family)